LAAAFWQGALVVVLVLVARKSPRGFASLGLSSTRPRAILVGMGMYLVALPALFGSSLLWSQVLEFMGRGGETQAVQEMILRTVGAEVPLAVALAVVVVPFLEEVIFRGWLQGWISHRLSPVHGIVIPAALFALMHGAAVLLPIFVLALLLGVVRQRTERLAPVFAMHALHNGIQIFFLLYFQPDVTAASLLSFLP
jgi:membrane protease YdiL (CAAX protease family)